ncbi:hypothetical protein NK8_63300 (plasmid) [Caballeronia sp. NK8]|uniref:YncE family protein n=1 Tax=Caballeronia sp. NK8 TaxID=140098 RepID=UPI001BB7BFAB|nr:YncE family protein [Caballeronia sp. NK8]BCQ28141.1 hypothetical protein NK8_63300 [Caballeronia sp. NK8]
MTQLNFTTGHDGLIAVDKLGNRVLFLDPESLDVILTLEGFAPRVHELSISPDRRFAFVPIYGDGRHGDNPHPGHLVAKFDLVSRRHMGDFSTAPYLAPHSIRWRTATELYCIGENSGILLGLDPLSGETTRAIPVGSNKAHRFEFTPDGAKAYTENEEDPFCSVIDMRSGERLPNIETPNGTAGIAISPDGSTVVLTDAREPNLIVIDAATDSVRQTIPLEGLTQPAQIARFSPDGRYLVVTSHEEPLGVIFDASLARQRRVHLGRGPMDLCYAPDGRTALIANHDEGSLCVVDLERGETVRTVQAGVGVEVLSFY